MRAYPPSKFRVSSISGSRDSRGAEYAPPPGRVILRPSPGDVLTSKKAQLRCYFSFMTYMLTAPEPRNITKLHCSMRASFHGAVSSLRVFITVPVCVICISHNFYICELSSGQIRDLYVTGLWENNEMRPASSKGVKITQFLTDYDRLTDL